MQDESKDELLQESHAGMHDSQEQDPSEATQEVAEDSLESNVDSSVEQESSVPIMQQAYKELEEKYMRAYADFENVKKRLEREKNQALEYAYEKIAKDLLPILDALDNAKAAAKEHSAILEGIALVQDNFLKILRRHGVEAIDTSGEFDPNLHECIMQVAKPEAQDGQIAQVMQQGYVYKQRTLRPAMVAVVKNN
ncbi:nucleotide exchange factor GrpE [Helicobacter zhangjianzhongii]|uniref:Nucleotide exchange factor GrpE n=1 Tax=Helicobacter zhangjianzhongii TaxID=2974574 RepID=A0ACC6FU05_9HELI|nr:MULTISPECIES: nucleotide exchange factor GrpE [unclassified Helicobacter]MDL0080595.1 nucleotide exchange factor GrpE [Helicobacter sp. CPD2-1]MDL0082764.1 nucleotide exchange factor GrpE [Helicobacter sp. XJK30-2]